jgi:hypothetical protein
MPLLRKVFNEEVSVGNLDDVLGSHSILGIAEFIVPTGSFFHALANASLQDMEELPPNVRMTHVLSTVHL